MCRNHFWNCFCPRSFFVIICVFVFLYVLHYIDPSQTQPFPFPFPRPLPSWSRGARPWPRTLAWLRLWWPKKRQHVRCLFARAGRHHGQRRRHHFLLSHTAIRLVHCGSDLLAHHCRHDICQCCPLTQAFVLGIDT